MDMISMHSFGCAGSVLRGFRFATLQFELDLKFTTAVHIWLKRRITFTLTFNSGGLKLKDYDDPIFSDYIDVCAILYSAVNWYAYLLYRTYVFCSIA